MSASNFALLVVTGHSGSGPGLPPSLRELPHPCWYHLQLPAFVLLIAEVHQAEITSRLVTANPAEEAARYSVACNNPGKVPRLTQRGELGALVTPAQLTTGWQQKTRSRRQPGLLHRTGHKLGLQPGVGFFCPFDI